MEPNPVAPAKQRSPWLYVLLGCLGFAALTCVGVLGVCGFAGKQISNMADGITDPKTREANARKVLGGIPTGYYAVASFSVMGLMETAVLTDAAPPEDGGWAPGEHVFIFMHVMGTEQNRQAKKFFTSDSEDASALRQLGVNVKMTEVIKRSQLTRDGRKVYAVSGRGRADTGSAGDAGEDGLMNVMLFDCPGDALNVGVWSQRDPDPTKKAAELDLAGTVADDAALTKFLEPVNPCGK